jgi:predicted unusual protein kinase regulating ubiquinone biosynthesis (AarF/ABC1/UbiB family)
LHELGRQRISKLCDVCDVFDVPDTVEVRRGGVATVYLLEHLAIKHVSPETRAEVQQCTATLHAIASHLDTLQRYGLAQVVRCFATTLQGQLDLAREANAMRRAAAFGPTQVRCDGMDWSIVLPNVLAETCDVLVMQRIDPRAVTPEERAELAQVIARYYQQCCAGPILHLDLHLGNAAFTRDSADTVVIYDWGAALDVGTDHVWIASFIAASRARDLSAAVASLLATPSQITEAPQECIREAPAAFARRLFERLLQELDSGRALRQDALEFILGSACHLSTSDA